MDSINIECQNIGATSIPVTDCVNRYKQAQTFDFKADVINPKKHALWGIGGKINRPLAHLDKCKGCPIGKHNANSAKHNFKKGFKTRSYIKCKRLSCSKPVESKGLCKAHYMASWRRKTQVDYNISISMGLEFKKQLAEAAYASGLSQSAYCLKLIKRGWDERKIRV